MSAERSDDRLVHARSLELAAIAVDFELTHVERDELDAHLAGCGSCARRVAALRADARALSWPLTVVPSARVDRAVQAAIERRASGSQRLGLLAAASLLLLAMLGAVAVGAHLLRTFESRPTTDLPIPTAPVAVEATIDPDASPVVVGETWESLPFIQTPGEGLVEAITFGGSKLVGVGRGRCTTDSDGNGGCQAAAWTEDRGVGWGRAPSQSGLALGRGESTVGPEKGIFDVAYGPAGYVAVGYDLDPLASSCRVQPCTSGPGVWRSQDGVTWERVKVDFGPSTIDTFSLPIAAVAGGPRGYLMVGYATDDAAAGPDLPARATAWASPDGVTWTRAQDTADMDVGPCFDTAEQPDCGGMRDVAVTSSGWVAVGESHVGSTGRLPSTAAWTSSDGLTWKRSDAGMRRPGSLAKVVSGALGLVAAGTSCDPDCAPSNAVGFAASSEDGATWTGSLSLFPAPTLWDLAASGRSMFAVGVSDQGPPARPILELLRTDDGTNWRRVEGLPSISDATGFRSLSLAASSDRVVVAGSAEDSTKGTFRNFSYASPPVFSATTETIPAHLGLFGKLNSSEGIYLASETTGWDVTGFGFYRTTDSARTWTMVRPPGWSAVAAGLVAVIDADTLYAALPGSPVTIAATHDGGLTWTQATIEDPGASAPRLTFTAPDRGFATFFADDGKQLRVYATMDGGDTWSGPVVTAPPSTNTGGKVEGPQGGVLWLRNGKADNEPFDNSLFLSMDGGATWKARSMPIGDAAPRDDLKWPEAMWADGRGRIVMAISLGEGPQVYESRDDGQTWRFVKGVRMPSDVDLLSATTWILAAQDGSEVWSTVDAGDSWRRIDGTTRLWLQPLSFSSPDHGWAIHPCPNENGGSVVPGPDRLCDGTGLKQVFLTTTDGGRTWTQLGE